MGEKPTSAETTASETGSEDDSLYDVEGHLKRFEIGRQPRSRADWEAEIKAIETLWQNKVIDVRAYELGRRPESQIDWDLELRLRESTRLQQAEVEDRAARRELDLDVVQLNASSDSKRAWVLISVVAALVAYPLIAMLSDTSPEAFGQYIAPITGIAGTVLGYWFGQSNSATQLAAATPLSTRAAQMAIPDTSKGHERDPASLVESPTRPTP